MALLDYKVSIGYEFDQKHEVDDERRVTDTFRVISLSFSNLGGPEVVQEYFTQFGHRGYEDRIYGNLGEHYLAKRRYDDAAKSYEAFVALYPYHRQSPNQRRPEAVRASSATSRSVCAAPLPTRPPSSPPSRWH